MKDDTLTTRRRFFWKAGAAALSAPLGAAAAQASAEAEGHSTLEARLARREALDAVRELNRRFARLVNSGGADQDLAGLFCDPAMATAHHHLRRVDADSFDALDTIQLAEDGRTASARIPCSVRIGTPMERTCSVVDMALQQGGGIAEHAESGAFEATYVNRGGVWKIAALSYRGARPHA